MKIGVDIDETIAATFRPAMDHLNDESGRNICFEDLTDHEWWKISHIQPPLTKEEAISAFRSFENKYRDYQNIIPIHGSQEKIRGFLEGGHTLVAITGRLEEYSKTGTLIWLERHFPEIFTSVYFTNHSSQDRRDKSAVCRELGISLMIEDNMDFALELATNGIRTYLLEKPWNRLREEEHPLVHRVKDWKSIII